MAKPRRMRSQMSVGAESITTGGGVADASAMSLSGAWAGSSVPGVRTEGAGSGDAGRAAVTGAAGFDGGALAQAPSSSARPSTASLSL